MLSRVRGLAGKTVRADQGVDYPQPVLNPQLEHV
jgi:hypothetical protein